MNNKLNNKVRPKYFQLYRNNRVLGICCVMNGNEPPEDEGWSEINEQEYRYLSKKEERSKVIGATK